MLCICMERKKTFLERFFILVTEIFALGKYIVNFSVF